MKAKASGADAVRRTWARRSSFGATVAAVLGVVVLIGSASGASLPAAQTSQKFVAPYSGSQFNLVFAFPVGCGNTMLFPVSPSFNMSSGVGNMSVKSISKPCGGTNSSNSVQPSVGLMAPSFTATSGGHYRFKANWVFSFSAQLSVNPGTSVWFPYAFFYVFGQAELSGSNGSTWVNTYTPLEYAGISSGTFTHTYSHIHWTVFLNATLPKSSVLNYTFSTDLEIVAATGATPGTVSTLASVNMGSGGKSATLVSYTMNP